MAAKTKKPTPTKSASKTELTVRQPGKGRKELTPEGAARLAKVPQRKPRSKK